MSIEYLKSISKDLSIDLSLIEHDKLSIIGEFNLLDKRYLDQLALLCADKTMYHPDWSKIAGRIKLLSLKLMCGRTFIDTTEKAKVLLNEKYYDYVIKNKDVLNDIIVDDRDDFIDWFGLCTGISSYFLKVDKTPIETPQQMFLRVAVWIGMNYPKTYSDVQGTSITKIKEIYDDLSLNNYMHATPTLFNSGLRRPQLSSCLVKDTEVVTMDGIKKIQDVIVGDLVVTHQNRVKKVLQVHKNPLNERKIYKLQVTQSKPVYVTENHRFWSSREKDDAEWRAVSELEVGDYIGIPSYGGSDDSYILPTLKVTKDLAKLVGIYLGNGYVIKRDNSITGIGFSILKTNQKVVDFIQKACDIDLNIKSSIYTADKQTTIQIMITSDVIGAAFNDMFGHKVYEKKIPVCVFDWSTSLVNKLFDGLAMVEKCTLTKGVAVTHLLNSNLTNQIYHLGRLHSITVVHATKKLTSMYNWSTEIDTNKFLMIDEIIETDRTDEFVYTLGVEDDHSYNVEGLLCENCFLLTTQDNLESISENWYNCAMISKNSGGIGMDISDIRHSNIGNSSESSGIVPMLKTYNSIMNYVDQCFHPDTIVYSERGPKKIGDIVPSDKLITSDGSFQSVKKILHYASSYNIREITIENMAKVIVVGVHPILVVRNTISNLKEGLKKGILKQVFVAAEDLYETDFVAIPIPKYEKDLDYDLYDCRLYGILITNAIYKDNIAELLTSDYNIIKFVEDYFNMHNIVFKKHEIKDDMPTCCKLKWAIDKQFPFTRALLYENGKKTIREQMLHLPRNKIIQIIRGLLEMASVIVYPFEKIHAFFYGTNVVNKLKYMLLRLGILSVVDPSEMIEISLTKEFCEMFSQYTPKTTQTYLVHDGFIYSRVVSNEVSSYKGTVVDLEMNGPNANYLTQMGIAHNGGKRKGSATIYISDHHIDILEFLELKKQSGSDSVRARDLFYAIWVSDLFMKRVKNDEVWSLFCPNIAKGMNDVWGDEFEKLYTKYENEKKYFKQLPARQLWQDIYVSWVEVGMPFILFKDACNRKSNQKNLGTIRSSNLCVAGDTMVLTDKGEYRIDSLRDKTVNIWNGEEFSEVIVRKTGEHKNLLKIKFSNRSELQCTPEHRFYRELDLKEYIEPGSWRSLLKSDVYTIVVDASGLRVRDTLAKWKLPNQKEYCDAVSVVSIEEGYRDVDTYCFTEHKRHMGMFNGIVTGQCTEILEYTSKDDIASCLTGDTMILTSEGYKRLDTCNDKNVYVHFDSDESFVQRSRYVTAKLIDQGKKEVYEVEVRRTGRFKSIKATADHKFLIVDNDNYEWRELREIKVGNKICSPLYTRNYEITSIEKIGQAQTYDLALSEGHHFIANGAVVHNCNLANIALNKCVKVNQKIFDFKKLDRLVRACVRNINVVIDINYYHENIPKIKDNNLKHRPMGIGVQGLADTFALLDYEWNSVAAKNLNKKIFETMYYAAITTSIKITKERINEKNKIIYSLKQEYRELIDKEVFEFNSRLKSIITQLEDAEKIVTTYDSFKDSPISKGILQFDMWAMESYSRKMSISYKEVEEAFPTIMKKLDYSFLDVSTTTSLRDVPTYDWEAVRDDLRKYGLRNSLLLALMPTASTAHLISNNESMEPFTSLIYARTVLSGQYMLVNKHMVRDFTDKTINIWSKRLFNDIVLNDGSVQSLDLTNYIESPTQLQLDRFDHLKKKYMTAYEIPQKLTAELAIDRGHFICQTQSFNCFMKDPSYQRMSAYMFYQWENGAKTAMYYLRSAPPANPLKIALTKESSTKYTPLESTKKENIKKYICQDDVCIMCQ